MVWYSHLFKNFPQFVVIHTVKGFGVVNKAKVDVFLEISCLITVLIGWITSQVFSRVEVQTKTIYIQSQGVHLASVIYSLLWDLIRAFNRLM